MSRDRTAIVTGAGSPRPASAARLLAARGCTGWSVAALDLDEGGAQETAALVADAYGGQAIGLGCDVTKSDQVDAAVSAVERDLPPVAALVNNAGIHGTDSLRDIDEEEWDRIFDVNVRGTYLVTRRVLAGLIDHGYSRIVNLSSVSAIRGGGVSAAHTTPPPRRRS